MEPFIQKYLPQSIEEFIGQDAAIKNLIEFIEKFDRKKKKKAALIYGPTGTGKTSSVYIIAKKLHLELIEVNASDVRNKEAINQRIGASIKQQSLFSRSKVILIDEIDGMSGTKDRGGIPTIVELIGETSFPIVFTATNPWDNKFSTLRSKSELIMFQPLDYADVYAILKNICKKEKISFDEDALKSLARRCGGDARAALNDLQMLTAQSKKLDKEVVLELSEREKEESMINALLKIFKTTDINIALRSFDYVNEEVNEQMLWLDENLPLEYDHPKDLARAYDKLSKADIFNRRIRRWQHWRFLVYINALLTAGISASKDEKYKKFVQYKPTSRLLKIWWANQKSMKKKSIAAKIANKTHTSIKNALKDFYYFKQMFQNNKQMANTLKEYFDLDKEEIEWLRK